MAFNFNLMTLCVVLVLGTLCEAEVGIHPAMTIERINRDCKDKARFAQANACFEFGIHCNPMIQSLVDVFPEVYKTACANCNERERYIFRKGSRTALRTDPQYFKRVVDRIDKKGIYWPAYMQFVLTN